MNQRRSIALRERPVQRGKRPAGPRKKRLLALGSALAALLVVVVLAVVILATRTGDNGGAVKSATPTGSQTVAGVEVQGASVNLGRQPLDKQITHTFVVKNTNARTVQLGVPAIEVLDGCWPPTPVVGATTLGPDQETTVSLTMMMHKGMEGPHLFRVTVPLSSAAAGEQLEMLFAADFE